MHHLEDGNTSALAFMMDGTIFVLTKYAIANKLEKIVIYTNKV